jgi:hypothetical protein
MTKLFSAKDHAAAYANAKTAPARKKIRDAIAAKCETNKRVRWTRLLADIDAGRLDRVTARGSGDWSAVARDVEPKAAAKPKAKPAKAKPKAKTPANDMDALVAQLADLDEVQMAAFFKALTKARA